MGLSYSEFKEYVRSREFPDYRTYLQVINNFNQHYSEDEIIYFYPINIFNENLVEFIFFLREGFLKISVIDDKICFEHYKCRLTKKTFISKISSYGEVEIDLLYDNGEVLTFKSIQDSNDDWNDEYTAAIKEIYKGL